MDEAERSGVDQLIGWPVGWNICLDAVQKCKGVATESQGTRWHVGKGRLQIGGLVDQRLGGSDEANSRTYSKGNRRPDDSWGIW